MSTNNCNINNRVDKRINLRHKENTIMHGCHGDQQVTLVS